MILRAKHQRGYLDIGSQENLETEKEMFRLALKPGQVVTIADKWRKLRNIDTAINLGLLEVISYDSSPGVEVVQDKASRTVAALDGTASAGTGYTFSLGNHKHDGAGGGGATSIEVTQAGHGFAVLDVLRSSGVNNQYTKAQADSAANAEVVGVVSEVTNINKFTLLFYGPLDSALVPNEPAGTVMFLSATVPGLMTSVEPTTETQVSKPVGIILASQSKISIYNFRGDMVDNANNYAVLPFVAETTVVFAHGLGAYPLVQVIDNTGAVVVPKSITNTSVNSVTVVFESSTTGSIIVKI